MVGDPVDRLPHLVTFSCLYVDGEALVTALDRRGFGVASGSACTASTLAPSHVLAAMGALTHGNVRLSLTRDATDAQVDGFLAVLPGVVARAARRGGPRVDAETLELDCRGLLCPLPVIELGRRLATCRSAARSPSWPRTSRPRGRRPGVVPDARAGVRRRGRRRGRHPALRGAPGS